MKSSASPCTSNTVSRYSGTPPGRLKRLKSRRPFWLALGFACHVLLQSLCDGRPGDGAKADCGRHLSARLQIRLSDIRYGAEGSWHGWPAHAERQQTTADEGPSRPLQRSLVAPASALPQSTAHQPSQPNGLARGKRKGTSRQF